MNVRSQLAALAGRGIDLSTIEGKLKYRAPKFVLTPLDLEFLVANKEAILEVLARGEAHARESPSTPAGSATVVEPAPRPLGRRTRPPRTSSGAANPPVDLKRGEASVSRNSGNPRNPSGPDDNANIANIPRGCEHVNLEDFAQPAPRFGVADRMVVLIGDRSYTCSVWDGETLAGERLGLDTETDISGDHAIPALALATASDGDVHFLIQPDRLEGFLFLHRHKHFVCHNVAFDHWVIVRHLEARCEADALEAWWEAVDDDRVHDTMLLDGLIRLGRTDAHPNSRDLAAVAGEYAGLPLDKQDPYRLRYAEIIGVDWAAVDRGFFEYAIKDPIATLAAYEVMLVEAGRIMAAHGLDPIAMAQEHGALGENILVKGAIALAAVTRRGIALDRVQVDHAEQSHRDRIREYFDILISMPGCRSLFATDRHGHPKLSPGTGAPSIVQEPLRALLAERAGLVAATTGLRAPLGLTLSGKATLKEADWAPYSPFDPVIAAWLELRRAAKACQFFSKLEDTVVHPKYGPTRTARTSCSGPNIQQMPRKGGFRESFVARPGFVLLTVDYRFIELRTLAAVCEARFGRSRLAEVIRDGIDPHAYTAAMLAGLEFEAFKALAHSDDPESRSRFDELRQKAKPVNFGIPGGLGVAALVAYALANYGVKMTLDEAEGFRSTLIDQVYPELALYLADDGMETLARNLGTTVEACWAQLDWNGDRSGAVVGGVRNVVGGKTHKADGRAYKSRYLDGVWRGLIALNRNPELAPILAHRKGGEGLRDRLFLAGVTTLTGRVRGRVGFTQARNTPFQGLAADGAKLAIYDLIRADYRVVAFVHDEVVIELPEAADHAAEARRVESIMNRAMERVTGDVPVACEYALSRRWSKRAKAVFDQAGRLIPCEIETP